MAEITVTNWFGNIVSHPLVVVDANSVDDIVRVLKDPVQYPSPVRVVGSNHSTSPCGVADGGTLIRMKMNKVLNVGDDTLTVEAGAIHLDLAKMLEAKNLMFYVNTEIGSLSSGSAACAGTKDASMPGEYGQVGSYVTGMKMVLPSGDLLEVTEADQPDLMKKMRCSYGTCGIVYEVTYKIRALLPMAVHHETFELEDFIARLPELKARGESMFYYIFPFDNKITIEFRKYNPGATGDPDHCAWGLRNHFWGSAGPKFGHDVSQNISIPKIRYGILDGFNATWRFQLENLVCGDYTIPGDQIIHYPPVSDDSRYTFSLFAFPEADYAVCISDFFKFVKDYYNEKGYRSNLLYVGYWIMQDQQSLLSYSYNGPVMTIDPVSTANDGWVDFLAAYNQFCSDRNGVPLLNQTYGLTPAIVQKAYGDRLTTMQQTRRSYDPTDRLLNAYFKDLLG
ncbi:FAD-binding oxidoreductase [Granulicella tundricola]|uniref:FAD linked oxidase domain protein n=1 Tax=Granulicella tundricola (strain ATCC BAA-1859 / DSM 23138 / MP5ACTX9) TaxID=1198114 RepID=E8X3T7_GRATM|nr:FAD-dependent oxidoreductase [Granulicella tundricola]ADW69365.1 FAD linked oxidase domain protein [Granulicella tundricola MP5ACTX9]